MSKFMKISIPEAEHHSIGAIHNALMSPNISTGKSAANEDWEWKMIEQLISTHIHEFLSKPLDSAEAGSNNNSTYSSVNTTLNDSQSQTITSSPQGRLNRSSNSPPHGQRKVLTNNYMDMNSKLSESKRSRRRHLIVECRKLRTEITRFEEQFIAIHNRSPKASDRGSMQQVYLHYKGLKRLVRDEAATDIQRVFRGMAARFEVQALLQMTRKEGGGGAALFSPSTLLTSQQQQQQQSSSSSGVHLKRPLLSNKSDSSSLSNSSPKQSQDDDRDLHLKKRKEVVDQPSRVVATSTNTNTTTTTVVTSTLTEWWKLPHVVEARSQYRAQFHQKHLLKSQLRRFDDEFKQMHGRLPARREKEVMRGVYERYHEVKATLATIKTQLEQSFAASNNNSNHHGGLTDDLLLSEELPRSTTAVVEENNSNSNGFDGQGMPSLQLSDERDSFNLPSSARNSLSSPSNNSNNNSSSGSGSSNNLMVLSSPQKKVLQEEKQQLLARLKAYERDFVSRNNRPVTKMEDIQPVAHDYKRYKEIKAMLNDTSSS